MKKIDAIEQKIRLTKPEVKKIQDLKKSNDSVQDELSAIENFKEGRSSTLSILKELSTILPKSVWLTRIKVTETGVNIEGYSNEASSLLQKIEISPYFQKAEFSGPVLRDGRTNSYSFAIKMELSGNHGTDKSKNKS